jgi:hypothetical protein
LIDRAAWIVTTPAGTYPNTPLAVVGYFDWAESAGWHTDCALGQQRPDGLGTGGGIHSDTKSIPHEDIESHLLNRPDQADHLRGTLQ